MITTINIRISSGHVNMPLPMSAVFAGSAATFMVEGVPNSRNGIAITSCTVRVTNAAGTVMDVTASRQGAGWTATFPSTHFANAGSVSKGVVVSCGGTDESNTATTWRLGSGDLVTIALDASATNLGVLQHVNYRTTEPSTPVAGDLCKVAGVWKLYNGTSWDTFGGGVSDYDALTSRPQIGGVTLTGNKTLGALGAATAAEVAAKYAKPDGGIPSSDMAAAVQTALTAAVNAAPQATTYTKTEVDDELDAKAPKASPTFSGVVTISGPGGSASTVLAAQGGQLIIGDNTASTIADLPYKSSIPGVFTLGNRVVMYYKVVTDVALPIVLPELPAATQLIADVVNLDLVIDTIGVTTLPTITINGAIPEGGSTRQTIYASGGALPEIKANSINVIDATSIPALTAWMVMGATELTAVTQS